MLYIRICTSFVLHEKLTVSAHFDTVCDVYMPLEQLIHYKK